MRSASGAGATAINAGWHCVLISFTDSTGIRALWGKYPKEQRETGVGHHRQCQCQQWQQQNRDDNGAGQQQSPGNGYKEIANDHADTGIDGVDQGGAALI